MPTSSGNSSNQLRQTFDAWDRNKNGHLDAYELGEAMKQLGEESSPETNNLMIEMFDKDKSGTIDFNEFNQLYSYIQEMKSAFNSSATSQDRSLNMEQVKTALGKIHGPWAFAGGAVLLFMLFKFFDKNHSGKMGWSNFMNLGLKFGGLRSKFGNSSSVPQQGFGPSGSTQQYPQQSSSSGMVDQFVNFAQNMLSRELQ